MAVTSGAARGSSSRGREVVCLEGGRGVGEALPGVRGSLTEIRPEVGFGQ